MIELSHVDLLMMALLPLVAFLYASVGHGGASGYLALMALFAMSTEVMKSSALVLNLFVAGIAAWHYYRAGYFKWRLFAGFAIGSVPAAFVGGMMTLDPFVYQRILGILLLFAVLKMLNVFGRSTPKETGRPVIWQSIVAGACIGLLSGMIGIGGGIILSPVILLLHWGSMKETAAVSALFIWVNSAAGLAGQFSSGVELHPQIMIWVVLALIGGFLGSYIGSRNLNSIYLKRLLALVLVMASVKLFSI